jgi:hypothetical protein
MPTHVPARRRPLTALSTSRIRHVAIMLAAACLFATVAQAADRPPSAAPQGGPAAVSAPPGPAAGFRPPVFSDDSIVYVTSPWYRNPHIVSASQPEGADIRRNVVEFTHVDAWKYGHNTIEFQLKKANAAEPAHGGGDGALGVYAILRAGLGINRLAGRPVIAFGPLRDIDLQVGMNLESKNSTYAPQERSIYVGPNFQFRAGQGFINVAVQLRKEWNHNGFAGQREDYDLNLNIEPVWRLPFRIGSTQFVFDGFADVNTAKGPDVTGHDTKPELITRPMLKLDVSRLVGRPGRVLEAGVGVEYWRNMYGKDEDVVPGAKQKAVVFALILHLPMGAGVH